MAYIPRITRLSFSALWAGISLDASTGVNVSAIVIAPPMANA